MPGSLGRGSAGTLLASALLYVALSTVFFLDVNIDRWFPAGMLYVPLVLLSGLTRRIRIVSTASGVAVVLTFAGALLSGSMPPGLGLSDVLVNRSISALAIGVCAGLGIRTIRDRRGLEAANASVVAAQQRLAEQHELLRLAGEVGRFGGWSADVRALRLSWSDEVCRIHGVEPGHSPTFAEATGYYAEEDQPRLREAFDRCRSEGLPFDEEVRLSRAGGQVVWVSVMGNPERDATGQVVRILGAFQDVTSRKTAELAAEESTRRLDVLADSMPLLVWRSDADGALDYVSRGLLEFTGTTPEEVLGSAWLDVIHDDDVPVAVEHWTRSVRTGGEYFVEFRIRRHDGSFRSHLTRGIPERDPHGAIVAWWGSCVDIEELRELEEQSRSLATRLTDTLESIGDAVLALDTDWRLTFVNRNAERLVRRSREELVGRLLWEVFPGADDSVFARSYRQARVSGEPVRFESEYPPLGLVVEVSVFPHAQGLTIYFRDITEQRTLREQLAHAQRLESLGQLTGGVAHDFNNLLTVIMGSSELLVSELRDQERLQPLAQMALDVAGRGAELTHNLLAFARKQPLDPHPVDVNELARSTHALLDHAVAKGIEVECRLAGDVEPCLADPGQLQNALLNLCFNARDAMPAGGRLTVATGNVHLDEDYAARNAEVVPGPYVMVAVTDDGEGIAPENLDRVFEPFFTTKSGGNGTGLGLAMVYGFVKQSGGHVTVTSAPGAGTTVTVYLPAVAGPVAPAHDEVPVPVGGTR